jgi:hypothetical protein
LDAGGRGGDGQVGLAVKVGLRCSAVGERERRKGGGAKGAEGEGAVGEKGGIGMSGQKSCGVQMCSLVYIRIRTTRAHENTFDRNV